MERMNRVNMLLEILSNEPDDIFTNYALAIEYSSEGDNSKAEKQFLKVLELNKEYLPCYYQLGKLFEKQNKSGEAISYYKKGLELAKAQKNNKAINEINEAIWMLEDN